MNGYDEPVFKMNEKFPHKEMSEGRGDERSYAFMLALWSDLESVYLGL